MAERQSSPLLSLVALAIVALVLWRVALSFRRAPSTRAVPGVTRRAPARLPETTAVSQGVAPPATDSTAPETPPSYMDELARSETRRLIRASARTTYLSDIVQQGDSMLHRWDNRVRDPVRIYLGPDTVKNFQPAFLAAVHTAFTRWDAANLPIRFSFVDDSSRAEVVFRWRAQFDIDRTGQTDVTWDKNDGHIQSAAVTLATIDPKGQNMGPDDIRIVALHEIGHLLGLNHSKDSADVMFSHTVARDLSERDVHTAQLLYILTPGSIK
jgi:hypothetical protein